MPAGSVPAPCPAECLEHAVGVIDTDGRAVIALQGFADVAMGAVQVVLEDGTTEPQIGGLLEQVAVGLAAQFQPEGHDLHESLGAGMGYGKAVKIAFHVDDG